jgi:hypothetical protein
MPSLHCQADKKWFKHPKTWLKQQHRVHLLCNGNLDIAVPSHFLFDAKEELEGSKAGYLLMQPTETLKRWGPVLKFTMGALSLAAKGAANFFAAGLGDMLPQLQMLFESDNFSSWSNEQVQDVIESIADGITDSVSTSVADKAEWNIPHSVAYEPCREAFAKWIEEQDSEMLADNGGDRFFGLKHYENTEAGVGDGKGTPLWLCKMCHPRWEEAKKDEAEAVIKAASDKEAAAVAAAAVAEAKKQSMRKISTPLELAREQTVSSAWGELFVADAGVEDAVADAPQAVEKKKATKPKTKKSSFCALL